jgi:putative transposase
MGRARRTTAGGLVYHVLNRATGRMRIFETDADHEAFERVLEAAQARSGMRILAYCVMPNHWHLVLWPRRDGDLSRFVGWLTLTHTQRWHAHRRTAGSGHLYQGRFKSFVVEPHGDHLKTVCRYVERNPLRAGLVARAEDWTWSSLWRQLKGSESARGLLADWPIERPADWLACVNRAETQAELKAVRRCEERGRPLGSADWVERTTRQFGLESTTRPRGRPRRRDAGDGTRKGS